MRRLTADPSSPVRATNPAPGQEKGGMDSRPREQMCTDTEVCEACAGFQESKHLPVRGLAGPGRVPRSSDWSADSDGTPQDLGVV